MSYPVGGQVLKFTCSEHIFMKLKETTNQLEQLWWELNTTNLLVYFAKMKFSNFYVSAIL